ncbi:hypothetical protein [Prevotella pallens]|uniref:hypothetical protein n=1 Tax=Prevotella pallens TaxID=60133 RepID=UPI0024905C68|nr:hypothetical protein [Prevotella pallens]
MRTLILSALALILSGQVSTEVKTKEATVYVCTGPKAKKYHATQTCRGLNRCSGSIRQLSVSSAKAKGFTPCRICYK